MGVMNVNLNMYGVGMHMQIPHKIHIRHFKFTNCTVRSIASI